MSWREKVFAPLLERTPENAQVHHLVRQYDLSQDSMLARAIVAEVNRVLDIEEIPVFSTGRGAKDLGIRRTGKRSPLPSLTLRAWSGALSGSLHGPRITQRPSTD